MILAIDPGSTVSAWVILDEGRPIDHLKELNDGVLHRLRNHWKGLNPLPTLAIERIVSYMKTVGQETFDTAEWAGRFREAWESRGGKVQMVFRRDVKSFHCQTQKCTDANIRAAIIDRFGGKDAAIGKKKTPGPLWGITADRWSALAIAICAAEAK